MTATINSLKTIYQGSVFSLVAENVTLDNGVTTDIEYIKHPGATAIIPMLDRTRVILIKQYRHSLKEEIWEIPAGTLDPQESVLACAQRELIEEAGFSADRWHSLGEIMPVPGYSNERIHIFLAAGLRPADGRQRPRQAAHGRADRPSRRGRSGRRPPIRWRGCHRRRV